MTHEQLDAAAVAAMRAAGKNSEIEQARVDGRLDQLLGITRHRPPADQWTDADVTAMYAEKRFDEIEAARLAGQLESLLNPEDAA